MRNGKTYQTNSSRDFQHVSGNQTTGVSPQQEGPTGMSMGSKCTELRAADQSIELAELALAHRNECAPESPFDASTLFANAARVLGDVDRHHENCWIVYRAGQPVGYAYGYCKPLLYNKERHGQLEVLYVLPSARGTYAAIKLIKAFEQWARDNGVVKIFLGVARDDSAEAVKIGKLFPKIGYKWSGTYYHKETAQ